MYYVTIFIILGLIYFIHHSIYYYVLILIKYQITISYKRLYHESKFPFEAITFLCKHATSQTLTKRSIIPRHTK